MLHPGLPVWTGVTGITKLVAGLSGLITASEPSKRSAATVSSRQVSMPICKLLGASRGWRIPFAMKVFDCKENTQCGLQRKDTIAGAPDRTDGGKGVG